MKAIECIQDLEPFGIIALTGEACGLTYRILYDLTATGRKIIQKMLDVEIKSDPWNQGKADDPHVASIMLSKEMIIPISIFALLESGCAEVFADESVVFGIEPDDPPERIERLHRTRPNMRRFSYRGTAGSRNTHEFTGRVE